MCSGESSDIKTGLSDSQESLEEFESDIKAKNNEDRIASELGDGPYKDTDSLRNHIENAEPTTSGRAGIKGAHNKNAFIDALNKEGAIAVGIKPNSQLKGVEKISYKMQKKNAKGELTGKYQSRIRYKTVYNPSVISTDEYIKRGLEAANDSVFQSSSNTLGREWTGTDNHGVHWHGYCDKQGNITSFYPED